MTDSPFATRWSRIEASKSYARPFMVQFEPATRSNPRGSVAVNGVELLYYRQFQAAVLQLTGELFTHAPVDTADDVQSAWLDVLAAQLPPIAVHRLLPVSHFDDARGRQYRFHPDLTDYPWAGVDADHLLEYQDFQAVLAHQTGSLYRHAATEAVPDDSGRRAAWTSVVRGMLVAPSTD